MEVPLQEGVSMAYIIEMARKDGRFDMLLQAIRTVGLEDLLNGEGPFTIFAPPNSAFNQMTKSELSSLMQDRELLTSVVTNHMVPGRLLSGDLMREQSISTMQGESLSIDTSGGMIRVGGAQVVQPDMEASNGVIHVIDAVLMPKIAVAAR